MLSFQRGMHSFADPDILVDGHVCTGHQMTQLWSTKFSLPLWQIESVFEHPVYFLMATFRKSLLY